MVIDRLVQSAGLTEGVETIEAQAIRDELEDHFAARGALHDDFPAALGAYFDALDAPMPADRRPRARCARSE